MGDYIKYVCLSDLHLGTPYSILTDWTPSVQSQPLRMLGWALEDLLTQMSGGEVPTLILLGDVLDLGLSPFENAAMGFQRFIEVLFRPLHEKQILSSTIIYVPGNHDHLVWTSARDQDYAGKIGTNRETPEKLDQLPAKTRMFITPDEMIESALLTNLMHSVGQSGSVRIAYPNFGLFNEDRGRCLAFHHGHFVESTYRLASTARAFLENDDALPTSTSRLERENAAWIDFIWSTFGETGAVGKDVTSLYTVMQDNAATTRLLSALEKRVMRRLMQYVPMGGEKQIRHYAKAVAKALFDATAERWADLERNSKLSILSDDSVQGLRWYLEEPLHAQIQCELGTVPDDVTFIFGHTHKPFADQLPLGKYRLPVKVFNTGGWTFNAPDMTPVEGAAAMFMDDELNLAQVLLFHDPMNGKVTPVAIPPNGAYPLDPSVDPTDPNANPLAYFVNDVLARDRSGEGLWNDFANAAADAVRARQAWVLAAFDADNMRQQLKEAR